MPRIAIAFVVLILFAETALSATQGTTKRRFFQCSGSYTLWEVFWIGASNTGQADLMEGKTNLNWTVKAAAVSTPTGSMSPATNLRWYRVRSQTIIPFVYSYTSMCWMPQQKCKGRKVR